jgi:hypothetical protein
LFVALAFAAAGGASAELLAVVVVVPIALWPGGTPSWWRRAGALLASLVIVSLPWLVPSVTSPNTYLPDKSGVLAFAARPDTPFGTVGSLASLGGIWNAQVTLPGRGLLVVSSVALVVTAASLWSFWRARLGGAWHGLVVAALVSFALAVWAATPGARRLAVHVGAGSTAGGLLRDGQRWLAPFALLAAVGFGWFVDWAARQVRVAPVLALVPVLLLPAAAWGSDGALVAVHWPQAWSTVAGASRRLPAGPVLVLPWASQRQYAWNGNRVLDDPADRWLPGRVVGDDALQVSQRSTPIEDPLARAVAAAATGTGPLLPVLQQQGYGGVLVERDQFDASQATARLGGLTQVVSSPTLALYAVPGSTARTYATAPVRLTLAADALSGLAVLMSLASLVEIGTRAHKSV